MSSRNQPIAARQKAEEEASRVTPVEVKVTINGQEAEAGAVEVRVESKALEGVK